MAKKRVGLLVAMGLVAVLSCSTGIPARTAGVKISFVLPAGTEIVQLFYVVTSSTGAVLANSAADSSDLNANLTLNLVLPAGTGDVASFNAITQDSRACGGPAVTFDVISGRTTTVPVTLTCPDKPALQPGTVSVSASVGYANHCPSITSAVAGPARTGVSSNIAVSATASDPDATDTLAFSWNPAGNFDHPSAAQALFTCTEPGPQSVTLIVSDNHPIDPCTTSLTLRVNCVVNPPPAENDPTCQPVLNAGSDTGFDQCSGSVVRRRAAVACPGPAQNLAFTCPPPFAGNGCATDADCTGGARNMCMAVRHLASGFCGCQGGCLQDSDCPSGQICDCTNLGLGGCRTAHCTSDASCGPGLECVSTVEPPLPSCNLGSLPTTFDCTTPNDQCRANADCGNPLTNVCVLEGDHRVCVALPTCPV